MKKHTKRLAALALSLVVASCACGPVMAASEPQKAIVPVSTRIVTVESRFDEFVIVRFRSGDRLIVHMDDFDDDPYRVPVLVDL